jgi:peptidoglycan/xylan/chitin deacetylase (PgdA/CDA1 family)
MITLLATGMHHTGALRWVQLLSHKLEVRSAPDGSKSFHRPRGPKFAVLCYHRVGTGGIPYHSELDPRVFEAQIAFLRRAYRIVTLEQLCHELSEAEPGSAGGKQAVAITFDDGYRDVYRHAFPILRKHGLPATVYLTASAIETGEVPWYDRIFALAMSSRSKNLDFDAAVPMRFPLSSRASRLHAAAEIVRAMRRGFTNQERIKACAELERACALPKATLEGHMLSWDQVREMQECGIGVGAHTMNHPAVGRLCASECRDELLQSKRLLEEKLQRPVEHFAFPFGLPSDLSPETCAAVPDYGYRSAATTVWGINTPRTNRYLLRRIGAEDLSVPQLAFYLGWLFFKDENTSPEMETLEALIHQRLAGTQMASSGSR